MSSETRIYFDACCFIDLAQHELQLNATNAREPHVFYCRKFLEASRAKELTVFTSTITISECVSIKNEFLSDQDKRIHPPEVKRLFEGMLMSAKSGVMPVQPTPRMIQAARDLRWVHTAKFKPMDSIHIATAIAMKCSHFVTTDTKLGQESIDIAKGLGLAICNAADIAHLLPTKFRQLALTTTNKVTSNAPANPPAG